MRDVEKRCMREFLPAMAAYTVVMRTVWSLVRTTADRMIRLLIALTPVVRILFVVRAIVRTILDADEMMQRLHLEALAISAGVVGVLSILVRFLVAARVIELDGSIVLWVFPALAGTVGLARVFASRRYARS